MASITSVSSAVLSASLNTSSLSTPQRTSGGTVKQVASAAGQALNTSTLSAPPAATGSVKQVASAVAKALNTTPSVSQAVDRFVAESTDSKLRSTQAQQLHEIAGGVRNGSLSPKEAEMLLKAQQDVFSKRSSAMADGKMTDKETIELQMVQQNVQKMIDTLVNGGERNVGSVFGLDPAAGHQATQLDKLADGLSQGTITRAETGKLLQQQTEIADKRGDADSASETSALNAQLARADTDIARHSKQGTQLDLVSAIKLGALVKG